MSNSASSAGRRPAQGLFVFLILFFAAFCSGRTRAQEATFDQESYYRAVAYCRNVRVGPMTLSPDRQILCFNGVITDNMDVYLAKDLKDDGLFVVRSPGGYPGPATELADILRDHHAMVVVYDFCFSACAGFLLVASHQTYVLKGTIVAWHYPRGDELCTYLTVPRDGGPRKLQRGPCQEGGEQGYSYSPTVVRFFKDRAADPPISFPPDSLYVRRIVRNLYAETGVYRDVMWTLHPRYNPGLFKTKIFYEAYPESQEELDAMMKRLHMEYRVIYDP